jgi:hypothetical protein
MLAQLSVPYVDVSAGDLCWALAADTGLFPLASVDVDLGVARVRLNVLGASHEVVATIGGVTCTEVVACGVGAGGPLPPAATRELPGLVYRMTSTVLRLDAGALAGRTRQLRARLANDERALVASFPGHAEAVTALAVAGDERGLEWRTWHAYPLTGELVITATRLSPP